MATLDMSGVDERVVHRFWRRVDRSAGDDGCWVWRGGKDDKGYGRLIIRGKNLLAHRVAEAITNGAIPGDVIVCHRCDNPICVNPSHLWRGSHADNMTDKVKKGRQFRPVGDRNGMRTKPERRPTGDRAPIRRYPERYAQYHESLKRISDEDVANIRARHAAGGIGQRSLAREYGVSPSLINRIVKGTYR